MKTLIILSLTSLLMTSDFNYQNLLEYSATLVYKESQEEVNLELGKNMYSTTASLIEEIKVSVKGDESIAKVKRGKEFEIYLRTSAKDEGELELSILKFDVVDGQRFTRSVSSAANKEKNSSMKFKKFTYEVLDKANGIYKIKITDPMEVACYALVFATNNGTTIPFGNMRTKKTLLFDVIYG